MKKKFQFEKKEKVIAKNVSKFLAASVYSRQIGIRSRKEMLTHLPTTTTAHKYMMDAKCVHER